VVVQLAALKAVPVRRGVLAAWLYGEGADSVSYGEGVSGVCACAKGCWRCGCMARGADSVFVRRGVLGV
jgi:hypothetical protein